MAYVSGRRVVLVLTVFRGSAAGRKPAPLSMEMTAQVRTLRLVPVPNTRKWVATPLNPVAPCQDVCDFSGHGQGELKTLEVTVIYCLCGAEIGDLS